ncbi:hypothetical protein NLI96_g7263 [Meripilus lineatus]|uniref:Histone-lysine N-methyltransferase, H3 lysine-4 specific n=1 Tax=Meripilus lineatus TaxID=2056292 RepID=A0AAD5V187_9APHY|nr:hypothetical protein NLI96_g7263 [Physisporinus lineatus]
MRVVDEVEVESEDEDEEHQKENEEDVSAVSVVPPPTKTIEVLTPVVPPPQLGSDVLVRKREPTDGVELEDQPVQKKPKVQIVQEDVPIPVVTKKSKKSSKKSHHPVIHPEKVVLDGDLIIHEVRPEDLGFDVPVVAQVDVLPPPISPKVKSSKGRHKHVVKPVPIPQVVPVPIPDPFDQGLCEDDEDLYFMRLALGHDLHGIPLPPSEPLTVTTTATTTAPGTPSHIPGQGPPIMMMPSLLDDPSSPKPFRVHVSGSARTEGYYKISHAEKSAYVAQYAQRSSTTTQNTHSNLLPTEVESTSQQQPTTIASSRSTRANARSRGTRLEEINLLHKALANSLGESPTTDLVKFNQLQTRKKHLRFARSPIHDWGLYAMEKISRGEMVIEYVGEVIRAQVADKREKAYERQGIGSSYLFRIDEDLVVDATKKGNLGRLINHSCDPNCTAKIITINGEKKIVIYAKQDIELGSEITYGSSFLLSF